MERITSIWNGMPAWEMREHDVLNMDKNRFGNAVVTGKPISRLAEYEDEEEQGRLIRLPCPINTKIYLIVTKRARSYSTKQFRFIKTSQLTWCNLETVLRNFGKTVFLDREEAVTAMERMNKEDENG